MPRKLFAAPTAQFLAGDNARPLRWIFGTLNEYFRTHIGFWGIVDGTTDANGDYTFTHDCGFEPAAMLVTEENVVGPSHDMGPFHIETYNSSTATVHFLRKTGNDRDSAQVRFHYLLLPKTS